MTIAKSVQTVLVIDKYEDAEDYETLLLDAEVTYQIIRESSDEQILSLCRSHLVDLIILEFHDSDFHSLEVLKRVKSQLGEDCPPILSIGINDAKIAVRAIKLGAVDYLVKEEITSEKLSQSIEMAIANSINQTQQDLRESEKRWREIIEHLPVGAVFVVDRDLRYHLAEGEALYSAGFNPEDLVGRTIFEVLPPELIGEYEKLYRQALAGETFVWEHNAHGATYISRGTPLRSSSGEIYAVLAVSYDISDRKQAEAVLTADLKNTQLLHDLSTRLVTESNIQVLYEEILAAAVALTRADAGTVQILDKGTQDLLLLATHGFERNMTQDFYCVNASSNTPCGKALATGERTFMDFVVGSFRTHAVNG